MSNFYLRTESIKSEEILDLCVTSRGDEQILAALQSSEPCLLEGSRGTGKSFLMRVAELRLEEDSNKNLTVFVSFNKSSLVQTADPLQFYHWMLAKSIKALINRLRKRGLVVSQHSASLLSNDGSDNEAQVELTLKDIVRAYEASYRTGGDGVNASQLPDIEDVKDAIEDICEENDIGRIYFFFDEAAHVFRPEQQRQFFNLFKDLRSPYITCNAAIYPGVTYFGDSFEITHDCLYRKIERDIRDADYVDYFRELIFRQADDQLREAIERQSELFNTLAFCCGGNPRMLLKTIQELQKFNSSSVNEVIKQFYRSLIWNDHTELGEKYKGHKRLIDWGRDFIESKVIPAIETYNDSRASKGINEGTIFFWVHKDAPETVKEALRLLAYTGIVRKMEAGVRATRAELGMRFEVKYGCILSLYGNPSSHSRELFDSLSLKKFPEFGKNHPSYADIRNMRDAVENENEFVDSVRVMLREDIGVLQLLTSWQKARLKEAGICTLEQLYQKTEEDLIAKIYNVGPARARLIKNAANAELLEYLSG